MNKEALATAAQVVADNVIEFLDENEAMLNIIEEQAAEVTGIVDLEPSDELMDTLLDTQQAIIVAGLRRALEILTGGAA